MFKSITIRVVSSVVAILILFAIGKVFGIALLGGVVIKKATGGKK